MASPTYNSDQLLDMCLLDYVIKKGMHKTAQIFREEAAVCNDPSALDELDGLLKEQWAKFCEIFASKHLKNQLNRADKVTVIPDNAAFPFFSEMQTCPQQFEACSSSNSSSNNTMSPPVAGSSASVRNAEEYLTFLTKFGDPSLVIDTEKLKFLAGVAEGPIAPPLNLQIDFVQNLRPPSILQALNSPKHHFLHSHGGFSSNNEVYSCDFSPNGERLAFVGLDQAIGLAEAHDVVTIPKAHEHCITSVRFNPFPSTRTMFATSSLDQTVKLWDAATRTRIITLAGHSTQVMSLDFNPTAVTLCSCACNDVRLWNYELGTCLSMRQGGGKQAKFQPPPAAFLAIATGNRIDIVDYEISCVLLSLKGHSKDVRCICWHPSGKFIASVSEDSARIWGILDCGKCTYQLSSNGLKFRSCMFDRRYPNRLVIGCDKLLVLWDPDMAQALGNNAHDGIVTELAMSPENALIASASIDHCVKVWTFCPQV